MTLQLTAPAKINWTLEVLGKRTDGYHEIRSVMQTISLADTLTLQPADELALTVQNDRGFLDILPEKNLTFRAADLLRQRTGGSKCAHVTLTKGIPVAAGLGGGSSDAAAVLRGLRRLWQLDLSDDESVAIASELGSDVPFFLRGGTALASGRGVQIEPLPDVSQQRLVVAWPERAAPADKTARMYAALRPEHYTEGSRTERLAERVLRGEPVRHEKLFNVFETVLPEVDPEAAELFERAAALGLGPHLCGSGPAFFFLVAADRPAEPLLRALDGLGLHTIETRTLAAAEAVAFEGQL